MTLLGTPWSPSPYRVTRTRRELSLWAYCLTDSLTLVGFMRAEEHTSTPKRLESIIYWKVDSAVLRILLLLSDIFLMISSSISCSSR